MQSQLRIARCAARCALGLALATLGMPAADSFSQGCGDWGFVSAPAPAVNGSMFGDLSGATPNDVWAVGYTAGTAQTLAMHWNGSGWSIVPTPSPSPTTTFLTGVAAIAPNDAWAVGVYNSPGGNDTGLPTAQTLALHWDGSTWDVKPSPAILGGSSFSAVSALATNDIWAVGVRAVGLPGPEEAPLTAHWDGSTWQVVSAPHVATHINRLSGVAARTPSDVWAVGMWKDVATTFHILILHWNGSNWSVVPAPDPGINDELNAVAAVSATDAWAVGDRHDPAAGAQPLIMHWNGSNWSTVALPVFPGEFNRLNAIEAISSSDVWAAGAVAPVAGGPPQALLMHWDGVTWSQVAGAPTDGTAEYFAGLGATGSCDLWAVGSYQRGGELLPLTERKSQFRVTVGVPDAAGETASGLTVSPNPAHGGCTISMNLSRGAALQSEVFDVRGHLVRRIEGRFAAAGTAALTWDGHNDRGVAMPPGLYFVRVHTATENRFGRIVLR